jgi:phytoene/squalene synthetase
MDDCLDCGTMDRGQSLAFVERQRLVIEAAFEGRRPPQLAAEEEILLDLVAGDRRPHSGLASYLRHMLAVMAFDAGRRGQFISEADLSAYTVSLATAVTDVLLYFLAPEATPLRSPARILAAAGAHIIHMLRDAHDDLEAGYINIPLEVLRGAGIAPSQLDHPAYRTWIQTRAEKGRRCLRLGKAVLGQVDSYRFRVAAFSYCLRFERVLEAIERDGFSLRRDLPTDRGPGWRLPPFAQAAWRAAWPARAPVSAPLTGGERLALRPPATPLG